MVDQRFIDHWHQQRQQQAAQLKVVKRQAWQDVQRITQILKQEFGVTQVFVYGSLVNDRFKAESDIDIAVAELAKERFYEAMATINEVCDRWVDLKPIESLQPYFWQRIQSQGIWVDETTEWNTTTSKLQLKAFHRTKFQFWTWTTFQARELAADIEFELDRLRQLEQSILYVQQ